MSIKIDEFKETRVIPSMRKYMEYNCSKINTEGYIVEFGVYRGSSINHLAEISPEKTIYGFDSFEGLPEEWEMSDDITVESGTFKMKELPKVKKNVSLVQGWFDSTLTQWMGENAGNIALMHLDCDIYSSTVYVLGAMNSLIKQGTVIIFDDLYAWEDEGDYPFWRRGQWKALKEWEKDNNREFVAISRMKRRHSGAILVTK